MNCNWALIRTWFCFLMREAVVWLTWCLASTCKRHVNRGFKCVHVTSFKLVTLWIEKSEVCGSCWYMSLITGVGITVFNQLYPDVTASPLTFLVHWSNLKMYLCCFVPPKMWRNMFTRSKDKGNKNYPLQNTGLVFLVFSFVTVSCLDKFTSSLR